MDNLQEELEIIKPLWDWNLEDVLKWLLLDFNLDEEFLQNFVFHEINGLDLIDLTEDNLKYDLKILKINLRKKILRRIVDLMKNSLSNNNNFNINGTIKKSQIRNKQDIKKSDNKDNLLQSFSFNKNDNLYNKIHTSNYKLNLAKVNSIIQTNKKIKINITLHYIFEENLKKMKFLCFSSNKVETIIKEFKDNICFENKKAKILDKYDNISICDENGYLIPKETYISEIINPEMDENTFYINKNIYTYYFEKENNNKPINLKINKKSKDKDNQIKTYRGDSNKNRKFKIDANLDEQIDQNTNKIKKENYYNTERNDISGFESLEEFEKKMKKNKKLINFLSKDKISNQINFNSKSLNNNYTSAFKDKINKFTENNSSINDSGKQNNYLSFEKLDCLEKNLSLFLDNNIKNPKNFKINNNPKKEKVTINSYYNISNLNNFNNKTMFNSLDKMQNNIHNHDSKRKSKNFSKSNEKRKRLNSSDDELNSNIDINDKNLENSELKKAKLKNSKHVFNLNLGKIIDGDKLKIERLNENNIKKETYEKDVIKKKNRDNTSDLEYSIDSEYIKINKGKETTNKKKKIDNKKIYQERYNPENCLDDKIRNKDDCRVYYQELGDKLNCENLNNFSKNNKNIYVSKNKFSNQISNNYSLSYKYMENSNTETECNDFNIKGERKNSIHNNNKANFINSIPRNDKNIKNSRGNTIKENDESITNKYKSMNNNKNINDSNNYIKIEENPSIKKNSKLKIRTNSDGDFCNYGDDVKNTKKSLYDEFFKNIDTDEIKNISNNNIHHSNNINNINYSGYISPYNNTGYNLHGNNNYKNKKLKTVNDSSFMEKTNIGNMTTRENSDKYYSKIINQNSTYENYNNNIPKKYTNEILEINQNKYNPGNLSSRYENNNTNYNQCRRSNYNFY